MVASSPNGIDVAAAAATSPVDQVHEAFGAGTLGKIAITHV